MVPRSFLLALAVLIAAALWLPACRAPASRSEVPAVDSTDTRAHALLRLAEREERLSVLTQALRATGMAETLQQDGPYTLFAPTDAAFRRRPALDTLLQRRPEAFRALLRYHIMRGRVRSASVAGSLRVSTLQGEPLTLRRTPAQAYVENHTVLEEIEARNGVLYLLPAVLERPQPDTLR